jgi:hypothetical protein
VTQLEVVRMIGDILTEIDVAIGSLRPGDPDLTRLQDLRRLLDARQLDISRQIIDDNTERFQNAARDLSRVNGEIKATITRIDDMVTVITNVTRFLNAVSSFVTTVGVFI